MDLLQRLSRECHVALYAWLTPDECSFMKAKKKKDSKKIRRKRYGANRNPRKAGAPWPPPGRTNPKPPEPSSAHEIPMEANGDPTTSKMEPKNLQNESLDPPKSNPNGAWRAPARPQNGKITETKQKPPFP